MTKEEDKKFKEIFNKATDRLLDTLNNNPDELFDIKKLSKQLAEKSQKIYNLVRENRKLLSKIDQQDQIIREAREYVKRHIQKYDIDGSIDDLNEFDVLAKPKTLLEILDRNVKEEQLLNGVVDENTIIHKIGSMIYYLGFNKIIEDLTWNKSEEDDYLTLKEIAEQVKFPVRVIMDYGLKGYIYEYGNYQDGKWRLYGITKGYA